MRLRALPAGPATAARAHGGFGLGSAIVRDLGDGHGGQVEAESAGAGKGSTFTVTLPAPPLEASYFFLP